MINTHFVKTVKSQSGQMIVEYILLTVIALGISVLIANSFRENETLGNLIASPWVSLSGMIQNGSWGDPASTMKKHPNYSSNSSTYVGESAK